MPDDKIVDPSIDTTVVTTDPTPPSNSEGLTIPKSVFDERLRAERAKVAALEEKVNLLSAPKESPSPDPDLEKVAEALAPMFVKKGFITQQQREEDENAKAYASQLKELSAKYDGKDGRPAFDPYEISEFAKETKVFDLETAYEKKYKKELFDWEVKNLNKGDDVPTEKPGEKVFDNGGNHNLLTREEIAKRTAAPGGFEWYEKNREALLKAMERGEIK